MSIAGPITTPHDQHHCYGSDLHCSAHHVDELPRECFFICVECGHRFPMEADLLADHNRVLRKLGALEVEPETVSYRVFCCPHCAHDF